MPRIVAERNAQRIDSAVRCTQCNPMPHTSEDVVKIAMDLSPEDRLVLAEILLQSTEATEEAEVSAAWDVEIRERIRAIEEGRVIGIPHEEVMREMEARLKH